MLNPRDGVALLDPDGAFRWLHRDPVPGRRANDAAVAPDGSLWAGTMRYDETPGGGTLTRLTGDHPSWHPARLNAPIYKDRR